MLSKKALYSVGVFQYILRLFFLIIVALAIVMLSRAYLSMSVDVIDLESALFQKRLLFDNNLVHQDMITGRIYPGIIKKKLLENEDFSKAIADSIYFGKDNKHIAAKIQLDAEKTVINYFNPGNSNGYDDWIILASSWIPGPGGATKNQFIFPNILYIANGKYNVGLLNITTVMRNS